jgi:hypothetical protein
MVWKKIFSVTLLMFFASLAFAQAQVPEGTIFFPDRPSFGANVHTHFNGKDLRALGIRWVRVDFSWAGIEQPERGKFNFTAMDKVVADYLANGMNVIGLLAYHYHCPLYPPPEKGFDAVIRGYAGFARAAAGAIRQADVKVHVAGLSSAWVDYPFIQRSLSLGLLQDRTIDMITFHGYHRPNLMPETRLQNDVD